MVCMHGNKNGGGYIYIYMYIEDEYLLSIRSIYPFLTRIGKYLLHFCDRKEGDRSLCNISLSNNQFRFRLDGT